MVYALKAQPQEEVNRASDLLLIQEAAKYISHEDTEFSIVKILRLLSQMLGLNRGRLLLANADDSRLAISYAYGLRDEEIKSGQFYPNEGITGKVWASGQTALIQNIDEEPDYLFRSVQRSTLPNEIVAYLAVPLIQNSKVIGVLATHRLRSRSRAFADDLNVLKVIATLISQQLRVKSLIDEKTAELSSENRYLKTVLDTQNTYGILGQSSALRNVLQQAQSVADAPIPILLTGESGTGKEKFARMLHMASKRRDEPFIAINCSAIPAELVESELFGHEKGAFTGATSTKKGKFELASGGTLFLDEIGDLDIDLQPKLLRVLEQQTITRVGSSQEIAVDVRFTAATHKNLRAHVNEGKFRLDLFYRLNVLPIELPSLRERLGDVRILARHFLSAANQQFDRNVHFANGVLERLESYSWPGNIRQLENVIKRAVLLAPEDLITRDNIETILMQESHIDLAEQKPQALENTVPVGSHLNQMKNYAPDAYALNEQEAIADLNNAYLSVIRPYAKVRPDEVDNIKKALSQARGNKSRAAMMLGLTARQLRYRMDKLGIA